MDDLITVASSALSPGQAGRLWWRVLGPVGIGLTAVGFMSSLQVWLPADFSNPSWAYAAASGFLDRAVLLATGTTVLAAAAIAGGHRAVAVAAVGLLVCAVLASAGSLALLTMNLAAAMPAGGSPIKKILMKRAYYGSTGEGLVLTATCLLVASKALGWARRLRRTRRPA